jgi:hypothetical protein
MAESTRKLATLIHIFGCGTIFQLMNSDYAKSYAGAESRQKDIQWEPWNMTIMEASSNTQRKYRLEAPSR